MQVFAALLKAILREAQDLGKTMRGVLSIAVFASLIGCGGNRSCKPRRERRACRRIRAAQANYEILGQRGRGVIKGNCLRRWPVAEHGRRCAARGGRERTS